MVRGDDEHAENRRHTDRRLAQLEADVRGAVISAGEERTMIHEDLARQRSWQEGHANQCAERWKANDDKWVVADKRFEGVNGKLNTIVGASFMTLLTVCGFFIALWIDRQNEHNEARRIDHVMHPATNE